MNYSEIKSPKVTIIAEGDSNEWSVGISKPTMERILKSGMSGIGDMIALWMFYAFTAKWQRTNRPRATVMYVMKGLDWGRDKVRNARRGLEKLGLISDAQQRGEDGKLETRYVKVNYLVKGALLEESTVLLKNRPTVKPPHGKHGGKVLNDSKRKCFHNSKENSLGLQRTRSFAEEVSSLAEKWESETNLQTSDS